MKSFYEMLQTLESERRLQELNLLSPFGKAYQTVRGWFGGGQQSQQPAQPQQATPDEKALGAKMASGMQSQQASAAARGGFGKNDLLNIKTQVGNYFGLIKNFWQQLSSQLSKSERGPEAVQFAKDSFIQTVQPQMQNLQSWMKWIDDMISWLPQRESIEDEEILVLEAIKVNAKHFVQMAGVIRALKQSLNQWVKGLSQHIGPHAMQWVNQTFVSSIVNQSDNLEKAFNFLVQKVQGYMAGKGQQFQTPTATAGQAAPAQGGYPAGTRPAFGSSPSSR